MREVHKLYFVQNAVFKNQELSYEWHLQIAFCENSASRNREIASITDYLMSAAFAV